MLGFPRSLAKIDGEQFKVRAFMRIRDFIWWTGRLRRLAYWVSLVSLIVGFLCLAISFPTFTVMLLPVSYLAFCLLVNRVRDAGLPGLLALAPFALAFAMILLYFVASFLTLGGGGGGTGGSGFPRQLYRFTHESGEAIVSWCFVGFYVVAGLLPSRSSRAEASIPTTRKLSLTP